jgi:hypothetical protein
VSIEDAVAGIAATVTAQGLKCTAVRDDGGYPEGVSVPAARMRWLEEHVIVRHGPHRDLNYTILPAARDIEEPEPRPGRPGRVPAAVLNHPALTGMAAEEVTALAAALEIPFGARREQRNYIVRARRRGSGDRIRAGRGPGTKIGLLDYVLAVRLASHLNLPDQATGALLGVDRTTVSHARALASELLAATATPLPETAPALHAPPRTPADLLEYAAAAGITIELPQNGQPMPEHFRTRRRKNTPTHPKPDT